MLDLYKNIKEDECTGLVFRGYSTTFYNKGRLERRSGIRLLKKRSCQCSRCSYILDDLLEAPDNFVFPKEIIDFELYTVKIENEYRDYESGYIADYDVVIKKLEKD